MSRASPEFKVQLSILKWLRMVMPSAMIQHCVNETNKGGKAGMITGARSKMAGRMPGFPDLIIMPDASIGTFFLEVKAAKGRVSESQKLVHEMLRNRGYVVGVVKSVDDVRDLLLENEIAFNEVML